MKVRHAQFFKQCIARNALRKEIKILSQEVTVAENESCNNPTTYIIE